MSCAGGYFLQIVCEESSLEEATLINAVPRIGRGIIDRDKKMSDAIIGGAIAAVIGAVSGAVAAICLEHRRGKAKQRAIVDALIIETEENLRICKSSDIREFWWKAQYQLEAYQSYKGQLWFLSEETLDELIAATTNMRGLNIGIQASLSRVAYGQPGDAKPILPAQDLIEGLQLIHEDLQQWKQKHAHCRLCNLVSTVYRGLLDFVSKIRKNSKLSRS